jgi:hypothetical protein
LNQRSNRRVQKGQKAISKKEKRPAKTLADSKQIMAKLAKN